MEKSSTGRTRAYNATRAHIVQHPEVCDGVPHIANSRVSVLDVYEAYQLLGVTPEDIMKHFSLNPVQVFSALTFIHEFAEDVEHAYERRRAVG
jgi:uncharacterized protein (DUF433 family)